MAKDSPLTPDEQLLLDQVGWVHRLAKSLVADSHAADDLVQETLLAAWGSTGPKAAPSGEVGLRAWLATVLRRRAVSRYRSDHRRRQRESTAQGRVAAGVGPAAEELIERAELQQSLINAVLELREPYRSVLLQHYFEGMTTGEIAQQNKCSAGTVRSQHKRGLELLRNSLDQNSGGRSAWMVGMVAFVASPPQSIASVGTKAVGASSMASLSVSGIAAGGIIMGMKSTAFSIVLGLSVVGGSLWYVHQQASDPLNVNPSPSDQSTSDMLAVDSQTVAAPPAAELASVIKVGDGGSSKPLDEGRGRVQGVVTDIDGKPLEGIVLHATQAPEEIDSPLLSPLRYEPLGGVIPALEDPQFRAVSDAMGRYELDTLQEARYRILARGGGYQQQYGAVVEVTETEISNSDFTMKTGFQIAGVVVDPDGNFVPGAKVYAEISRTRIESESGDSFSMFLSVPGMGGTEAALSVGRVETVSDEQGRFLLEGLSSGQQQLRAQHRSWAISKPIKVSIGSDEVVLRLRSGARIAGRVLQPDGEAAAGIEVSVENSFLAEKQEPVVTTSDGRFELINVTPGNIRLIAISETLPMAKSSRFMVADDDFVTDFELQFSPASELIGSVVRPDGSPLAGAVVVSRSLQEIDSRPRQALTDKEGKFVVGGLDRDQMLLVTIEHSDYVIERLRNINSGEGVQDVGQIIMRQGATVSGVVLASDSGEVLAGVSVRLQEFKGDARNGSSNLQMELGFSGRVPGFASDNRTKTDAEGKFQFERIEPGRYQLRVQEPGYSPYLGEEIDVVAGSASHGLELLLDRGLSISGRVVDVAGLPIAGAKILAYSPRSFQELKTVADNYGNFELSGLSNANYQLEASDARFASTRMSQIAAGAVDVTLVMQQNGSLKGRVEDLLTAAAVAEFKVKLVLDSSSGNLGDHFPSMSSFGGGEKFNNGDGLFLKPTVAPGQYLLTVSAKGFVESEQSVVILPGQETVVTVEMDLGGALEGYIRDRDGRPIVGARVERVKTWQKSSTMMVSIAFFDGEDENSNVTVIGAPKQGVLSDDRGYYQLSKLPHGDVDLKVSHQDFRDFVRSDQKVERHVSRRIEPIILSRGGVLTGVLSLVSGEAMNGVTLLLYRKDEEGATQGAPMWLTLKADGSFERKGLAPGKYELVVQKMLATNVDSDLPLEERTAKKEFVIIDEESKNLRLQLP